MGSQTDITDLEPDIDDGGGRSHSRKEGKSKAKRPAASARAEKDLRDRLVGCFERIAESLYARQDEELAELVREDAEIIAQGLVSLTRPFTALRTVVLAIVAIIEPLMAFGRIGRVLLGRLAERRAARAREPELDAT